METIEIETDYVQLRVSYNYDPGSKDYFDKSFGQMYPGDPPSVELVHVWVGHSNGQVDILNSLSGTERSNIEEYCIENTE